MVSRRPRADRSGRQARKACLPLTALAVGGLDVSQDSARGGFLRAAGEAPQPRWPIPNTQPGADARCAELARWGILQHVDQLRMGREATGLLWWQLAGALKDAPALAPFPPLVYARNPQLGAPFRQNFGALPKSDPAAACLIAERLRDGRPLPAPVQIDTRSAPRPRLTRLRRHLVTNLVREKNSFLSFLFLTCASSGPRAPFGAPFGATRCAVLQACTTEELAQHARADRATYLQDNGPGRCSAPCELAGTLQRAARDSYRLDKVLQEPLRLLLGTPMATIRTLPQQLKAGDKPSAQERAASPQTLARVPGRGPVWPAGWLAELGDRTRFDDHGALAPYAGLTWPSSQSGEVPGEDTAMRKRGTSDLRDQLIEAATSGRSHCPEQGRYDAAKDAQPPRHAHQRARVLPARKLVRLIAVLLREGRSDQMPEQREGAPAATPPQTKRPGPQRRSKRAGAIREGDPAVDCRLRGGCGVSAPMPAPGLLRRNEHGARSLLAHARTEVSSRPGRP